MVLELAVTSQSDCIITFNKKDFHQARDFGISIYNPFEFLSKLGEKI
jgi:predicted nucleic acid-binding protein